MEHDKNVCANCNCSHHKFVPLLIVLFGLAFVAQNMGWMSMDAVSKTWPVLVVLAGLFKMFGNKCKCC